MGLHICYELSLPVETPESKVREAMAALRERASTLPFAEVSALVRLSREDLEQPSPLRGLSYVELEDVVDVGARSVSKQLFAELQGGDIDDEAFYRLELTRDAGVVAIGFAVAPGKGSEPASFALLRLDGDGGSSRWWWHCCCKTQYASVVSDEHLIKCHRAVIDLLDAATDCGLECVVRDEAGFYQSRDEATLLANVHEMNRIVARFAGAFTNAFADAGGDTRQVQGEIFRHPDFERLETKDKRST